MKRIIDRLAKKSGDRRSAYGKLLGIVGVALNILLSAGKFVVGTLSGSVSITADAVNNLTDVSASLVTLLGFHLAEKPADKEHPYGHARMEYLAGLIVSFIILICGYELAKSSVNRILNPQEVSFSIWSVLVLVMAIFVKFGMMVLNKKVGKKIRSLSLIAAATDSRNDVITTSAVLICNLVGHFTALQLDGYMGLLVALFILYSGFCVAKDTADPLLGLAPDEDFVLDVADTLKKQEYVLGIHDLMVHDYGPKRRFASVHVEMDKNLDPLFSHNVIDNIEREFAENKGVHLLIHYDPVTTDDAELNQCRNWVEGIVKRQNALLTIHDFRMVEGPLHTNIIFDVVVPYDLQKEENQLKEQIEQEIRREKPHYYPVICMDSDAFNTMM